MQTSEFSQAVQNELMLLCYGIAQNTQQNTKLKICFY